MYYFFIIVSLSFFIRVGDELLSVNGTSFEDFTHQQALDTFKVNSE